jgi:hypothetical protein
LNLKFVDEARHYLDLKDPDSRAAINSGAFNSDGSMRRQGEISWEDFRRLHGQLRPEANEDFLRSAYNNRTGTENLQTGDIKTHDYRRVGLQGRESTRQVCVHISIPQLYTTRWNNKCRL